MSTAISPGSVVQEESSPRVAKGRRSRSLLRNNIENSDPSENTPPVNRFGFKKRSLPGSSPGQAPGHGRSDHAGSATQPPIDLISVADSAIGNLDAASNLLRMKVTSDSMKYDYKAKITALNDMISQLKSTLSEHIKRARSLGEVFAPLQEDINARLLALADEASMHRSSLERLKNELGSARQRGEERGRRAQELKTSLDAAVMERTALVEHDALETARADAAEATLVESRDELGKVQIELEELRQLEGELRKALDKASAKNADMEEKHRMQLEASSNAVSEQERLAAERESALRTELEAAAAHSNELQAALVSMTAARDELSQTHAALSQEHTGSMTSLVEKTATLQRLEAELELTRSQLQEKDDDLRASIKSVTKMQLDNSEQLTHERLRVQKLEIEVNGLRDTEQSLRAELQERKVEAERMQGELAASKQRESELEAKLLRAESEKDQLSATITEQSALIQLRQADVDRLSEQLGETRESLAATKAMLETRVEQVDKITEAKRVLELEFRSYKEHHGSTNQQQMEAITELRLMVDKLSQQVESKQVELGAKEGNMAHQQSIISALNQKLLDAEVARRQLHNTVQELKGNIRVFCRVRPGSEDSGCAVDVSDNSKLCLKHSAESYNFNFDKVFDQASLQTQVFEEVDGLVQSALDGYKVCIFAYGQTGSGKTFTMQGTTEPTSWGLIPRSLSKILEGSRAMSADGWEWTLEASFLEVYNETLRDLLQGGGDAPPALNIKHEEAWGTVVAGLSRYEVSSMQQINMLMAKAAKQRAVGATDMNSQSSRSHSVFALYLKGTNHAQNTELHGALHLVDLAGSERLDRSGVTGDRLRETQNINKSLSSLADVFAAKAERRAHVPFRNSKLTYLMEPCLSGQGKTLMVVNVGPEQDNSHETLCSLRFASQVSQCDTGGKPKRAAKAVGTGAAKPSRPTSSAASSAAPAKRAK